MSAERNCEVVHAIHAAVNARDLSGASVHLDPDFELDLSAARGPLAGLHRGRDAVKELLTRAFAADEPVTWDLQEVQARGSDVIVINRADVHLWSFRDGLATRMCLYRGLSDVPA